MGSVEFFLFGLRLSYSPLCICLFDAIVDLHAMDDKMLNDFRIGKWKWIFYVRNSYSIWDIYFVYGENYYITMKTLVYIYESIF